MLQNYARQEKRIPTANEIHKEPIIFMKSNTSVISIYSKTADTLKDIFSMNSEYFDVNKLNECVEDIVEISKNSDLFPLLLGYISLEYSTHEHSTNVAFLAAIIGRKLNFDNQKMREVIFAALSHDIGKLRIDSKILDKPSSLEDDEFEHVKLHSLYGVQILQKNGINDQSILHGVFYHHERLDGSGYTEKLKGKKIQKYARIIGMCDVFDALTTRRTFRRSYSSFEALMHMKREMRLQLDGDLVNLFIALHR